MRIYKYFILFIITIMNEIINIQKKKFINIEYYFNLLLKNIKKSEDLENIDIFIKKLYLLNKSLEDIQNNIIILLNELHENNITLSDETQNILEEDKINKSLVKEVTPILLYYLMYKNLK